MAKEVLIYGIHSVEEELNNKYSNIKIIYVKKNSSKLNDIITLAKIKNIKFKFKSNDELNNMCNNENHQGVAAIKESADNNYDIDYNGNLILVLDHIQDTHNLGAILRTAEFFKVDGVIIPDRRAAKINPVVYKIAEGAVDKLNIKLTNNLMNEIKILKEKGFWIIGTDVHKGEKINKFKFPDKTALVIGNEHKGISRLIYDNLDFKVTIPRIGETESLNVSVATGIFLAFIKL